MVLRPGPERISYGVTISASTTSTFRTGTLHLYLYFSTTSDPPSLKHTQVWVVPQETFHLILSTSLPQEDANTFQKQHDRTSSSRCNLKDTTYFSMTDVQTI